MKTGHFKQNIVVAALVTLLVALAAGGALLLGGWDGPPAQSESNTTIAEGGASTPVAAAPTPTPQPTPEPTPQVLHVSFSAVGDNLIHTNIYTQAKNRAAEGQDYDFSYAYENLAYFFENYDVNWINQETLVNDEFAPSSYPCFSSPGALAKATYDVGWRVYGLSNNHTYDKLGAGVNATLAFWQSMPDDVVTVGLYDKEDEDSGIALQEVNGISFAYVAYTEHTNGINPPSSATARVIYTSETEVMERQVRKAREMADVVVVCVHWGVENSHTVTQAQRNLALLYAEWGADVILGTHPHVMQEVEIIQSPADGHNVLVAYSLGNFLSTQNPMANLIGLCLTFEVELTVEVDGTRGAAQVINPKVYPVVTHYERSKANVRSYMLRDYTDELAAAHGSTSKPSGFGLEYIRELAKKYIGEEYLVLD